MPSELRLVAMGSTIAVPTDDGDTRTRLAAQWSRCLAGTDATPVTTVELSGDPDPHRRDYALASAVTRAGIAQLTGRLTMFHACGVCDPRTGRSAVLVAPSGTGKTTAAARLCSSGFGYISDETIAFGPDRVIRPYPKPLSVVLDEADARHKSQHSPDELGLLPCRERPVAAMLVLLDRDDDHRGRPCLEPVPLLEAVLELIPQTSALPALPDPLNTLCDHIAAMGGAMRLRYGDIEETADLLRRGLAAAAPVDRGHRHLPPPGDTGPGALGPATADDAELPSSVRRAAYSDAVAVDEEVLVLIGTVPVHLSGLGATIWRYAVAPAPVPDLLAVCREAHGDHPDAASLVDDAVRALLSHGLLEPA